MPEVSTTPGAAGLKKTCGDMPSYTSCLYQGNGLNHFDRTSEDFVVRVAQPFNYGPTCFEDTSQEHLVAKHQAAYPSSSTSYLARDENGASAGGSSALPHHNCSSNSLHRMEHPDKSPAHLSKTADPLKQSCAEYAQERRYSTNMSFNRPGQCDGTVLGEKISQTIDQELVIPDTSQGELATSSSKRKCMSTTDSKVMSSFESGDEGYSVERKKNKTSLQMPISTEARILRGAPVEKTSIDKVDTLNMDTIVHSSLAPDSALLQEEAEAPRIETRLQMSDGNNTEARQDLISNKSHEATILQNSSAPEKVSVIAEALLKEAKAVKGRDYITSTSARDVSDSTLSTLEAQTGARRDSRRLFNDLPQMHELAATKVRKQNRSFKSSIEALIGRVDDKIRVGSMMSPSEPLTLQDGASTDPLLQAFTLADTAAFEIDKNVSSSLRSASLLSASISGARNSPEELHSYPKARARSFPAPVNSSSPKENSALAFQRFSLSEKLAAAKEHLLFLSDGSKLTIRAKFFI